MFGWIIAKEMKNRKEICVKLKQKFGKGGDIGSFKGDSDEHYATKC